MPDIEEHHDQASAAEDTMRVKDIALEISNVQLVNSRINTPLNLGMLIAEQHISSAAISPKNAFANSRAKTNTVTDLLHPNSQARLIL